MDLSIILPLVLTATVSIIGWLIKDLLTKIKKDLEKLFAQFAAMQMSLVKLDATLTQVEKDVERANSYLNKTSEIALKNSDRITSHGHDINNLKNNVDGLLDYVKEVDKRVNKLETK